MASIWRSWASTIPSLVCLRESNIWAYSVRKDDSPLIRKLVPISDSITRAGNAAYVAGNVYSSAENDNFGAGIAFLCAEDAVFSTGLADSGAGKAEIAVEILFFLLLTLYTLLDMLKLIFLPLEMIIMVLGMLILVLETLAMLLEIINGKRREEDTKPNLNLFLPIPSLPTTKEKHSKLQPATKEKQAKLNPTTTPTWGVTGSECSVMAQDLGPSLLAVE
ncbi:Hypothetical predicted protein [Olea europaea subsp. europaea]|uniref:Uncharacterized protein n=1 Tax=Olea europaea subsp. europaea TaxID=158383 RepID=A0A8S0UPX9_OLEEU|nr:Hypothetical predicted protein [Olea europaea subsp. europaea]